MFHFFGYWSVEVHGMTLLDLFEIHSRGQNVQFQRKHIRMHDDVDKGSAKKGYLIWTHEWFESYLGKCFSKWFNGFVVFSTKKNFRWIFTADLVGTYFCFNHLKDRSESTLLSEVYFNKYSFEVFIAFVKRLMSRMYKEKRKLWLEMVVFYFYF